MSGLKFWKYAAGLGGNGRGVSVRILEPATRATLPEDTAVTFTATAEDADGVNIATSLVWTSDVDGLLGNGATFSTTPTNGEHKITATATDSEGRTGSARVTIRLSTGENPVVSITSPTELTVIEGNTVVFTGSAFDDWSGDLTSQLSWDSDIDNQIGTGGTFTSDGLSVGTHTVIASVTDSDGDTGSAQVVLTVATYQAPVVTIDTPLLPTVVNSGDQLTFTGTATVWSGDASASIVWSVDGVDTDTGDTFVHTFPTAGVNNQVRATITDSQGATVRSAKFVVPVADPAPVTLTSGNSTYTSTDINISALEPGGGRITVELTIPSGEPTFPTNSRYVWSGDEADKGSTTLYYRTESDYIETPAEFSTGIRSMAAKSGFIVPRNVRTKISTTWDGTLDADGIQLLVNDVVVANQTVFAGLAGNDTFLVLGRDDATGSLMGLLHDVKIWIGSQNTTNPDYHYELEDGFGSTVLTNSGTASDDTATLTIGDGSWSDTPLVERLQVLGDSISYGFGATSPFKKLADTSITVQVENDASENGQSLGEIAFGTISRIAEYPTCDTIAVMAGTNDIYKAGTAEGTPTVPALSALQRYIESVVQTALGQNLQVVVCQIIPRGGDNDPDPIKGWNAERQSVHDAFNAWLVTYYAGNTQVNVAYTYNAVLDSATVPARPAMLAAYSNADGYHPNDAGTAQLALAIDAAITAMRSGIDTPVFPVP